MCDLKIYDLEFPNDVFGSNSSWLRNTPFQLFEYILSDLTSEENGRPQKHFAEYTRKGKSIIILMFVSDKAL